MAAIEKMLVHDTQDTEFAEDLNAFFFNRQDKINGREVSTKYSQSFDETNKLCESLLNKLDEPSKRDLISICDALSFQEAITKELSYKRGFQDGIRLLSQMLGKGI